jgi:hypothetical protein
MFDLPCTSDIYLYVILYLEEAVTHVNLMFNICLCVWYGHNEPSTHMFELNVLELWLACPCDPYTYTSPTPMHTIDAFYHARKT